MTTRDEIPPCTCVEFVKSGGGNGYGWRYGDGNVGCQRHPNASATQAFRGAGPPQPESGSVRNLRHWHDVHAEERQRRQHVRDDEEPEYKPMPPWWRR